MGGVVRRTFGLGALFAAIARTGWAQGLPRNWQTPDDAEIRRMLKDRIEVQKQGVGLVVGVIDASGRRIVAEGATAQGDTRTLDGQTVFEIFPESRDRFFWRVVDAQATFERGPDGRATAVTLHQTGTNQKRAGPSPDDVSRETVKLVIPVWPGHPSPEGGGRRVGKSRSSPTSALQPTLPHPGRSAACPSP
jgi:hypothetical protein